MVNRRIRWTNDFKETIDSGKKIINELFTSSEYELVRIGLILFSGVLLVLVILNFGFGGADWSGILTEAHGMLMDIFIFGVLLTAFERFRNRNDIIKNYQEQLKDFKSWSSEEGVLRKVGILYRLNEMRAPIPNLKGFEFPNAYLSNAYLEKAILKGANLVDADLTRANMRNADLSWGNPFSAAFHRGKKDVFTPAQIRSYGNATNLSKANLARADLTEANLEGANLYEANLERANLEGAKLIEANLEGVNFTLANLEGADIAGADLRRAAFTFVKNLTCEQIQSAKIDRKTILPNYIKISWADDDTFNCENVKTEEGPEMEIYRKK